MRQLYRRTERIVMQGRGQSTVPLAPVRPDLFGDGEEGAYEKKLYDAYRAILKTHKEQEKTAPHVAQRAESLMVLLRGLASLQEPLNAFFDGVKVQCDDEAQRENRLNLLGSLCMLFHGVVDFQALQNRHMADT